jgi:hypothetical protein
MTDNKAATQFLTMPATVGTVSGIASPARRGGRNRCRLLKAGYPEDGCSSERHAPSNTVSKHCVRAARTNRRNVITARGNAALA